MARPLRTRGGTRTRIRYAWPGDETDLAWASTALGARHSRTSSETVTWQEVPVLIAEGLSAEARPFQFVISNHIGHPLLCDNRCTRAMCGRRSPAGSRARLMRNQMPATDQVSRPVRH